MDRLWLGRARHASGLPYVSIALATVAFSILAWSSGRGWAIDLPWAPTLGLRLDLALDGLGALYALLATGIGGVVFVYALALPSAPPRPSAIGPPAMLVASGPGWCCSWARWSGWLPPATSS